MIHLFRKKISLSMLCVLLFIFTLPNPTSAASVSRPIDVNINGKFVSSDSSPFIQAGRVMIPVRLLASFGLQFSWNQKSNEATITSSTGDVFKMIQGQRTAYKNNRPVEMDSEAGNYSGRIMVPARFVSEAFGYSVFYESARGILFINGKDYTPDPSKFSSTKLHEARLSAISLPIHFPFKDASKRENDKKEYYVYSFAKNDASKYAYDNGGVITVVEIKGSKAEAVGQLVLEEVMLDLYKILGGKEPDYFSELFEDNFAYDSGKHYASYNTADGSRKSFNYETKNYGEIIQPVPAP